MSSTRLAERLQSLTGQGTEVATPHRVIFRLALDGIQRGDLQVLVPLRDRLKGIEGAITAKTVTYDFERLMDGATLLKCSEFGKAIVEHMS